MSITSSRNGNHTSSSQTAVSALYSGRPSVMHAKLGVCKDIYYIKTAGQMDGSATTTGPLSQI